MKIFIKFSFHFLENLLLALQFTIFLVVIFSWFPTNKTSRFNIFLNSIASPVLMMTRKITPKTGMLDLSPIVAFLIIDLLHFILQRIYFFLI